MAFRIGDDTDQTLNTNVGLPDDDFVWGAGGNDFIQTFDLDDEAHGGLGNDTILGGLGNDWLFGYGSNTNQLLDIPTIHLEADDTIANGIGPDAGGALGKDIAFGGNDFITGGAGIDHIYGGGGDDKLYGSNSARSIESGSDFIFGGAGNDVLFGGDRTDQIDGGSNRTSIDIDPHDVDIAQFRGVLDF
jgi:serralysin